jgi:hypothetical protein
MKPTAGLVIFSCLLGIGNAQVDPASAVQPSPFEKLLRQPDPRIIWSQETGRLDSSESHAVVTALVVVEESTQPSRRLRGVRIHLSRKGAEGDVYLEERVLEKVRKGFDQITMGIQHGVNPNSAVMSVIGSCEWRDTGLPDPFPVSYIVADWNRGTSITHLYWSGLVVSPPNLPAFEFPDQKALPFAEAIGRARFTWPPAHRSLH